MLIFPPLISRVDSECIPSSPEVRVIFPPLTVKLSLEWMASSEESMLIVPPVTNTLTPAFSPLALKEEVLTVGLFLPLTL
jgi:hypothetical protein